MADPRHEQFARTLVEYSLAIQRGDHLLIVAPALAAPLVREVYRAALRAGAYPDAQIVLEDLDEIRLREASAAQLAYVPAAKLREVDDYNAHLRISAAANTRARSGIDPARLAIASRALAPRQQRFMARAASGELRWCGTLFPTQAHAQDAGMALAEYEDFVYGAMLLDTPNPAAAWRAVHTEQARIIDYLARHDEIHIVAPDTDLTYRVGGRTWNNSSGARNFPSGEVFTGPIEASVQGTVRFTHPAVRDGHEVHDVRLTFRDGKVVAASAARGEDYLHAMLETDAGARYLGEVAFGLNYGITRFTRNILFDEKIGGTMHVALGKSYPDTGGVNDSAIHWDMICDLHAGRVYADGELCYEAGRFVI
jgi:aminopeptidase